MNVLCSACLLGICTRYDQASKPCERILALSLSHTLIPVCPEQLGGLPTPRCPSEIQPNGHVMTRDGLDVDRPYRLGAQMALHIARLCHCDLAILKSRSPSCGKGEVYDGSFSGRLKAGNGVFTSLCIENGITVYSEEDLDALTLILPEISDITRPFAERGSVL